LSKRNLNISFWYQFLHKADKLLSLNSDIYIEPAWLETGSRDCEGRLANTLPQFHFRDDEEMSGWPVLHDLGISDTDQFVCLIVRDSAYLEMIDGPARRDYHSFRDTNIQDYAHVANELAQKGYWVLRMGKVVESNFDIAHPKVIDYANSDWRSDFMDIWLMSKCYFCISTSTGFDSVADMFRKPFAFVNFMPLRYFQTWSNCVLAPSHLIWKHSGTYLNCRDHLRHGYQKLEKYVEAGIEVRPLQPREITATVLEVEARMSGTWTESTEQLGSQKTFWDIYRSIGGETPADGFYHAEAFLSAAFLESNPKFLN
jgi:putative glycosyltransferase (TIGR04372 family)